MQIIAAYVGEIRHVLEDSGKILSRANQALATLERYKLRLDEVSATLSALEIEDLVTVRDVAVVAQRLEMVTRIAREIEDYVLELGTDGRLLSLQLEELITGVDAERELVIRDYLPTGRRAKGAAAALARLEALSPTELRELRRSARKGARLHLGQTLTLGPEAVVGGAVIGALSAFGLGVPLLALPILALGLAALALDQLERLRARRLAARIRAALVASHSPRSAFAAVCGSLTGACTLGWAGLVGWHEYECRGSLEASFGSAGGPGETALTSWLLREAEATDRVIVATPGELGGGLVHLGVPLRGEQGLHGYLVVAVAGADRRLERALAACAEELALRLSPSAPADRPRLAAIAS
jgi:hypothetical protein